MKYMSQKEHHTATLCMLKVDTCTMTQDISCHHVTQDDGFHSRPVHVGFVVDRVAVEKVSSWYFILSLSVSFCHCFIPISLIYHQCYIVLIIDSIIKTKSFFPLPSLSSYDILRVY
jgi:hypothetical protein